MNFGEPIFCDKRSILHCDLNGFFASVEELSHPEIEGKPMAVCGDPEKRHGIILAKNEAAKKFKIKTGETIWQARLKCPNLILLPAHHDLYEQYSVKVNEIYSRFTNRVEAFGIDESWLDVSASLALFGDAKTIADKIRKTIKDELKLTVSVGISFNKVFAKLGSDYKKPDATTVFDKNAIEKIVYKLPAADLLYVGKNTAETLARMGIHTIGDLANADEKMLIRKFGKMGKTLHEYSNGLECDPVAFYGETQQAKSIGNSITFSRDLRGKEEVMQGLGQVADKVALRLKESNLKGSLVQVSVKGADFSYATRQTLKDSPTDLRRDLIKISCELMESFWNFQDPIRLLGISVGKLVCAQTPTQGDLFDIDNSSAKNSANLEKAFYQIRKKYGENVIRFGNIDSQD